MTIDIDNLNRSIGPGTVAEPRIQIGKLALFAIFLAMFFGAITFRAIHHDTSIYSEFGFHIEKSQAMAREGRILEPHFLFHVLTIAAHDVITLGRAADSEPTPSPEVFDSWAAAALIVITAAYAATTLLLYSALRRIKASVNGSITLAFCLSIVAPLFLLAPIDGWYYLGYLSPSTIYIIPTQVLLKLTTLALFLLTCRAMKDRLGAPTYILLALLVVANGLAKPNYLIIMGPALITLAAMEFSKGRPLDMRLVAASILPAIAVLAWQYHFKFVNTHGLIYESSIILTTPFEVWGHHSDYVPLKFLLSSAFPIYVAVAYWNRLKADISLKFAWLLYFYGLLFTAFVAESGFARYAGNFVWSGQIANFVLFVASALTFFSIDRTGQATTKHRYAVGVAILSLHVLAGLFYYFRNFIYAFR